MVNFIGFPEKECKNSIFFRAKTGLPDISQNPSAKLGVYSYRFIILF
jgi:hypothetical protein